MRIPCTSPHDVSHNKCWGYLRCAVAIKATLVAKYHSRCHDKVNQVRKVGNATLMFDVVFARIWHRRQLPTNAGDEEEETNFNEERPSVYRRHVRPEKGLMRSKPYPTATEAWKANERYEKVHYLKSMNKNAFSA